jgi:hypothetical protein
MFFFLLMMMKKKRLKIKKILKMREVEDDDETFMIGNVGGGDGKGNSKIIPFDERSKSEKIELLRFHYPDLDDDDDESVLKRPQEEEKWLSEKFRFTSNVRDDISKTGLRMIAVNEHYAVALEDFPKDAVDDKVIWMKRETEMYEQRIARVTSRLQVDTMMKELASKIRTGLYSEDFCKNLRKRLVELRDRLPEPETLEEVAGGHEKVIEHERMLNQKSEDTVKERPAARVVTDLNTFLNKKLKKKNVPFEAIPSLDNNKEVKLRITKHTDKKNMLWSEPWFIPCFANLQVFLSSSGGSIVVADQYYNTSSWWVTRVRIFKHNGRNNFDWKKPVFERIIDDKKHVLGRLKKVCFDDEHIICIMYERHVICCHNGKTPFVVVFDKPMCSSIAILGKDTLVIGTINGSIYFFSLITGEAIRDYYIDIPFPFEILGMKAQQQHCDSILLVWDHRNIYRFTLSQITTTPPFEMNVGRPMGVSGYGGLICALQDMGNVWLANTIARGNMRFFQPPEKIAVEVIVAQNEQTKEKTRFHKLLTPITYDYQATWLTRDKMITLYPSGIVRTINI